MTSTARPQEFHVRKYGKLSTVGSGLGVGAVLVVAGAVMSSVGGFASATTVVTGLLATAGGCQSASHEVVVKCTEAEPLTPEVPVMLDLNPIGTHVVVLGAGLFADGSIRPVLESRLDAALRLVKSYPFTPIVVSGGVPQSGRTEAQAMREWLTAHGVAEWRIISEDTSRSTLENAANTNRILGDRNAAGAVVVTSPDHLRRALTNFRDSVAGRIPVEGVVATD
ncbi:YdcF family protein [Rhodococcus jostii]|uniref:YdcF family protein n=1 Tax=Rhodococcus jostii TaxID=132919 RepID=UPI003628BA2C